MNENKVPCGGFRIGDGLTMEGDTLKSLGGAYVKVNSNGGGIFEFMDDSPLKTFEEIVQKKKTSVVTMLVYDRNVGISVLYFDALSSDSISFSSLSVDENVLTVIKISIDSDNKITFSVSRYTLTPAT